MPLLSYTDLHRTLPGGLRHILVGNGSSIGVHAAFAYPALWPLVKEQLGDCAALTEFMDRCASRDIEEALRGILYGNTIEEGTESGDVETLVTEHYELFQEAFIRAVAHVHPAFPGSIDAHMWDAFRDFLADFHHVFTLNYDLLLYWLNARARPAERWFDGYFPGKAGRLVFATDRFRPDGKPCMVFLHGALHLYHEDAATLKHAWDGPGRGIIAQLRESLEARQLPLFVSEGTSEHKHAKIAGNLYLDASLDLLVGAAGVLVTFGASFSESDRHIARAIGRNPNLTCLALGVFGQSHLPAMEKTAAMIADARKAAGVKALQVLFYDTSTIKPWGAHARVVQRPKRSAGPLVPWVATNDPYEDDRASKWDPPLPKDPYADERANRWDV